ncbi:aspartate/tyrosine/aromatic aminotransferase [Rhodovulum iodosum]|uniref:Aminotransferase n=1 Tax=Rhodovulum iodosum TaxID=68291 RepID=A0ABV3XXH8_9RHOB|nr:amino acid aminotransferase [Rhodovulum robiginosum]RSK38090.1 aspartate/tyrosine/aromatic aminotransferase [Rhodovulum robiginosum]
MLERLQPRAPDKIIGLMQAFRNDPRPDKIDLGVGVYRDAAGLTPVMRAVKAAERQLCDTQTTKSYTALTGDPAFLQAMAGLVLGAAAAPERLAMAAAPGGTGALHIALALVRLASPGARVFVPDPSWPNHAAIADALGLTRVPYRYYDAAAQTVDEAGMLADLAQAGPGDVVLVHGCCHNPTGADLTPPAWQRLGALLAGRGAPLLVDLAYQGFGDGPEADVAGLRAMAETLPEMLIAVSCSKTFGLYRERVGAVLALTGSPAARATAEANLAALNRTTYAFPPDHGARLAGMVLADPDLRADWAAELEAMRTRIARLRSTLAEALTAQSGSDRFGFLAGQKGLFSLLGATPDQVATLRETHGIYMIGDSRINLAGLSEQDVPRVVEAFLKVGL